MTDEPKTAPVDLTILENSVLWAALSRLPAREDRVAYNIFLKLRDHAVRLGASERTWRHAFWPDVWGL